VDGHVKMMRRSKMAQWARDPATVRRDPAATPCLPFGG
jgi:hypothetical protein